MDGTRIPRIERPANGVSDCSAFVIERTLVRLLAEYLREAPEEMVAFYLGDDVEVLRRPWEEAEARILDLPANKVRVAFRAFQEIGPEEGLFKISKRRKKWKH